MLLRMRRREVTLRKGWSICLLGISGLILLAVAGCGGGEEGAGVNRIAYVSNDGDIYTIRPDGSDRKQLTDEGTLDSTDEDATFYSWPTWSPDGQRLVVSRVMIDAFAIAETGVYVIDVGTGEATQLYENPPNVFPFIASRVPHYMYWSPDSGQLAFIAKGEDDAAGLNLFLSVVDEPAQPVSIIVGSPIYLAWTADSGQLLLHSGDEMFLVDTSGPAVLRQFNRRPTIFRAPAWSSIGGMAYGGIYAGAFSLFVADASGDNDRPVIDVGPDVAFLWSPTQDDLAIVNSNDLSLPYYQGLRAINPASGEVTTLTQEPVIAFFWSPDGAKIAYVGFDPSTRALSWNVIAAEGGQPQKLVDFVPTSEFLDMLTFFDQYANSSSLWSPDSRHLVFSGRVTGDGAEGDGSVSQVYVVDVEDPSSVEPIATGSLAFWSWN